MTPLFPHPNSYIILTSGLITSHPYNPVINITSLTKVRPLSFSLCTFCFLTRTCNYIFPCLFTSFSFLGLPSNPPFHEGKDQPHLVLHYLHSTKHGLREECHCHDNGLDRLTRPGFLHNPDTRGLRPCPGLLEELSLDELEQGNFVTTIVSPGAQKHPFPVGVVPSRSLFSLLNFPNRLALAPVLASNSERTDQAQWAPYWTGWSYRVPAGTSPHLGQQSFRRYRRYLHNSPPQLRWVTVCINTRDSSLRLLGPWCCKGFWDPAPCPVPSFVTALSHSSSVTTSEVQSAIRLHWFKARLYTATGLRDIPLESSLSN